MRNMFLSGMLLLCLWACGTSSQTVREEPNKQSAKDLVGAWQFMESDKNGNLVPALAWPQENSTTVKKIEISSNKTWHLCYDSVVYGVYIIQGNRIMFRNEWENEVYHANWTLQDKTLELVFDIGYLVEPISLLTRTTPCKK